MGSRRTLRFRRAFLYDRRAPQRGDEDPLDDLRNTESLSMVMLNGRLYDALTLNEIGNHPSERPLLYWERLPPELPAPPPPPEPIN